MIASSIRFLRVGYDKINARNSIYTNLSFAHNVSLFSHIKCSSLLRRFYSFLEEAEANNGGKQSFAVSYLINSCGLSPEVAHSKSNVVKFESSVKPDSVLALLRDHGFEISHISKIISRHPNLLLSHPEKTILPKLKFFLSVEFSNADLVNVISSKPEILKFSLKNTIIPCHNLLKSVVSVPEKVMLVIKRCPWIFAKTEQKHVASNLTILKQVGVPHQSLSILFCCWPRAIAQRSDKFSTHVEELIKMGFHPSKGAFVRAIFALSSMSKSTFISKVEAFKRWGWSDRDIMSALRSSPLCMCASLAKIDATMQFLVNELGIQPMDIVQSSHILTCSLEKRIIPRCLIVRVLQLKGLLKKDINLFTVVKVPNEKQFLDKFVTKYQERVPEVLSIYQSKVGLQELGKD